MFNHVIKNGLHVVLDLDDGVLEGGEQWLWRDLLPLAEGSHLVIARQQLQQLQGHLVGDELSPVLSKVLAGQHT